MKAEQFMEQFGRFTGMTKMEIVDLIGKLEFAPRAKRFLYLHLKSVLARLDDNDKEFTEIGDESEILWISFSQEECDRVEAIIGGSWCANIIRFSKEGLGTDVTKPLKYNKCGVIVEG